MNSCPACSLPATDGMNACPSCGSELLGSGPWLARMRRIDNRFEFLIQGNVVAVCENEGDLWVINTGGPDCFYLLTSRANGAPEGALLDGELRSVVAVRTSRPGGGMPTIVRNADDSIAMILRSDGNGGINIIAVDGSVLAFAGRSCDEPAAMDILITDMGVARPLVMFMAAAMTLEIEHAGPLFESRRRLRNANHTQDASS